MDRYDLARVAIDAVREEAHDTAFLLGRVRSASIYNVIRISFADGSVVAFDAGKGLRLDELVASVGRAKS